MKRFFILFLLLLTSIIYSQPGIQNASREIYFLDAKTGWLQTYIINYGSVTIKTKDAGETWELQKVDSFYTFHKVFYNDSVGFAWASSRYFPQTTRYLGKTTNRGETWESNPFGNNKIESFYFFKDGITGFGIQYLPDTLGRYNKIYFSKTIDGGKNWTTLHYFGHDEDDDYTYVISWVVDSMNILITDRYYAPMNFRYSLRESYDGGINWRTVRAMSGDEGGVSGLTFSDSKTGYFKFWVDFYGTYIEKYYKTIDCGNTWDEDSIHNAQGTFFINPDLGYKAFDFGLYKTTDKGVTWDSVCQFRDTTYPFFGFQDFTFVDEYNGFSVKTFTLGESWENRFCKTTDGGYTWECKPIAFDTSALVVTYQNENHIPNKYSLEQNYPNPFNPSTIINYSVANSGIVKLVVYDIIGREVATLVNEYQSSGAHNIEFNAANLNSGVYFYVLRTNEFYQTKKMVLIK
ncbi:MAG TPA: T9SS type A sorting domain-containing protein [Ignavibacteriaceae bacterium]|nr:T9SS type A sorting domain-containing protein [Ignavibacteriaceae bacterium]